MIRFLITLFGFEQKKRRKTLVEYQEEMVAREAREQFQKLMEKGLGVPIALL